MSKPVLQNLDYRLPITLELSPELKNREIEEKIFQYNKNLPEGWASQTQTSCKTTRYMKERRLFNTAPASDLLTNQITSLAFQRELALVAKATKTV